MSPYSGVRQSRSIFFVVGKKGEGRKGGDLKPGLKRAGGKWRKERIQKTN